MLRWSAGSSSAAESHPRRAEERNLSNGSSSLEAAPLSLPVGSKWCVCVCVVTLCQLPKNTKPGGIPESHLLVVFPL